MARQDEHYMAMALREAAKGRGLVEPNPQVGAVLVKEGKVLAVGYHREFGAAHAEVDAIRKAGDDAREATLYVNLEPCVHEGKTPPCVDSIVDAGNDRDARRQMACSTRF